MRHPGLFFFPLAFPFFLARTSEQVPARIMEQHGVVNHVYPDDVLLQEATDFACQLAKGPTAHKALLRAWAVGGVAAADEALFDIAMPLFETEDVKMALPSAVNALKAGNPRPTFDFKGR